MEKIDSGPEAAGGRAITESRAAGDEKTPGHSSPRPTRSPGQSLRLARRPPVLKPVCTAGSPGESWAASAPPDGQTDRQADRQAGPRPPPWGSIIHFSLVPPPSSLAFFRKFPFLAPASLCHLQGLAPSRRSVNACWRDESVLSLQRGEWHFLCSAHWPPPWAVAVLGVRAPASRTVPDSVVPVASCGDALDTGRWRGQGGPGSEFECGPIASLLVEGTWPL